MLKTFHPGDLIVVYTLTNTLHDVQTLDMPVESEVLGVRAGDEQITIYVHVKGNNLPVDVKKFMVFKTGEQIKSREMDFKYPHLVWWDLTSGKVCTFLN